MPEPSAIGFVDFCQKVLGVKLTLGQRTLARVAFDRVEPSQLDGEEREMAQRLFGPIDTVSPEARLVLVVVKGMRTGGSYIFGALYSLWRALTASLTTLAPGEVAVALIVAPDLRLARQTLRYAAGAAESVPSIARLIESNGVDGLTLRRPDGRMVSIEVLPATRGGSAVRGRSLVSAVLSETAFFRDAASVVNDEDVFDGASPRVMPGGMTVLESTPYAETGLLHKLFSENFATPTNCLAACAPTLLMRGDDEHTVKLVANARAINPEKAARECDAQFILGGSGLFFGPELLRPAVVDVPVQHQRPGSASVSLGADIGLVSDASAIAAVASQGKLLTLLNYEERKPSKGKPLKLSSVIAGFCTFATRYEAKQITVDHHELEAGREHLATGFRLTPCAGGADARVERFMRVRELFRQEQVRIPRALSAVVNQLSLVVSRPKPGGGVSIVLPRSAGTHLDVASAFILAIEGAAGFRESPLVRAMRAAREREKARGTMFPDWRD